MPHAFLGEKQIFSVDNTDIESNNTPVLKLAVAHKDAASRMGEVIDVVSARLQKVSDELSLEREMRSEVELRLEDKIAELESLKVKYDELLHGLVRVLTQKFPGESNLEINNRLEALLLASKSGVEIGLNPSLKTNKSTVFLNLIEETL